MMMDYAVEAKHISKSFPGVMALDDVYFNLKPGEVMALLGENGAGKSTLVKILSGVYTRDEGEIQFFGEQVGDLTPSKAKALGVAIIHQELNMCAHLTVAENIFLGRELTRSGVLSEKEMHAQSKALLDRMGLDIGPGTIVGDLSVSKRQMVEIAKAISTNARILIMDEPTSSLTSTEIDFLFSTIRNLKAEGCGIIYISHRLEELKYIADRVTIMRDGKYILTAEFSDITMDEIISEMVGREIKEKFPRIQCQRGKKIFEIKNLNAGRMVRNINLELYEGEIVGVAGLIGSGRSETMRAVFGADSKDSGEIMLDGMPVTINNPLDAINAGIVLVPEDRKKDGLCTGLSIRENISLPNLDFLCDKIGAVNGKKEGQLIKKAVDNLRIKLSDADADAASLSGGNQQKVVVAKWLARNSRVILFDEPTRGIDVAVKVEIYNIMNELKKQGIGVLFVSSELPEILGISDRIIIMCDGRITCEMDRASATQDLILKYATMFENKMELAKEA